MVNFLTGLRIRSLTTLINSLHTYRRYSRLTTYCAQNDLPAEMQRRKANTNRVFIFSDFSGLYRTANCFATCRSRKTLRQRLNQESAKIPFLGHAACQSITVRLYILTNETDHFTVVIYFANHYFAASKAFCSCQSDLFQERNICSSVFFCIFLSRN